MSNINFWYRSEVSRWRSAAALVWTVAVSTPVIYSALAFANLRFLHPLRWIYESTLLVFAPWTWLYVAVITIAHAVLAVQNARQFSVLPVIHSTRCKLLHSIIQMRSLYHLGISAVLCGLIAWCFTCLVGGSYYQLSKFCSSESNKVCLNEHHIFIVLNGIYVGICYKLMSMLKGQNHLIFPVVQQSKFFQLKSSTFSMVIHSIIQTLHRLKYFYLVYYLLLGSVVKNIFADNFGLTISPEATPIDSLSGLLDPSLLWHSTWTGTLILCLLALSSKLFKLYHTEWFEFPIEISVEQFRNLCLHNALSCQDNDMVQFLGYQDFYMLSKHSVARRQQMFSLTQLGGHPQNWSNISKECMGLLKRFLDEVKGYNTKAMADGSMKQLSREKPLVTNNSNSLRQRTSEVQDLTVSSQPKPSAVQLLSADLKKRKLIAYFLAEEPDTCSRKLFAKSQLYIWAVEALSMLVCASYAEDRYGVVQKSLPEIIENLLQLQEQVEKHFRLVANIGKRSENDQDQDSDASLRSALKATLKSSIYRIVTIFEDHIRSIPLSSEHTRRLNHFLDYKE